MRLGAYQCASPAGGLAAGEALVGLALGRAAEAGVDLLVMPELFLPGYNATTAEPPAGWDGIQDRLAGLCREAGVALAIGLPEYAGEAVFNSAYVWDAGGVLLAKYRKVQLFGSRERALFKPGDALCRFEYRETVFGLLICYDVEFPEHVRALARAGAEVIITPTANMMPYTAVSLVQVPGRALESGLTIVYANYCGAEDDLDYVGLSVIAGPDGSPLATKGQGEGLLVADVPTGAGDVPRSTQLAEFRPITTVCDGLDQ